MENQTPKETSDSHKAMFAIADMSRSGCSVVTVDNDNMEPTLFKGDTALTDTSVSEYIGEGLYVLDWFGVPTVYRLQSGFPGKETILINRDNAAYEASELALSDLNELVLGKVIATGKVVDQRGMRRVSKILQEKEARPKRVTRMLIMNDNEVSKRQENLERLERALATFECEREASAAFAIALSSLPQEKRDRNGGNRPGLSVRSQPNHKEPWTMKDTTTLTDLENEKLALDENANRSFDLLSVARTGSPEHAKHVEDFEHYHAKSWCLHGAIVSSSALSLSDLAAKIRTIANGCKEEYPKFEGEYLGQLIKDISHLDNAPNNAEGGKVGYAAAREIVAEKCAEAIAGASLVEPPHEPMQQEEFINRAMQAFRRIGSDDQKENMLEGIKAFKAGTITWDVNELIEVITSTVFFAGDRAGYVRLLAHNIAQKVHVPGDTSTQSYYDFINLRDWAAEEGAPTEEDDPEAYEAAVKKECDQQDLYRETRVTSHNGMILKLVFVLMESPSNMGQLDIIPLCTTLQYAASVFDAGIEEKPDHNSVVPFTTPASYGGAPFIPERAAAGAFLQDDDEGKDD